MTSFVFGAPAIASEYKPAPWSARPSTTVVAEQKTFRNGEAVLSGTLYMPSATHTVGALVVTHTASKPKQDTALYRHLTEALPPLGIAVFLYDRRGSGASSGDSKTADFTMLADDAVAAVRLLKADARIDPEKIGIWGLSQGGWLALLAAARSPDVRFVISVAAPVVPPDVQMMYRSENYMRITGRSEAEIDQMLAARRAVDEYMKGSGDRDTAQSRVDAIKAKPWFKEIYLGATVQDRKDSRWRKEIEFDPLPTLESVKVPALILFGSEDPVVPVSLSAQRIEQLRRPNLTMRVIAGADHHMAMTMSPMAQMDPAQTLTVEPESIEYISTLTSWLTAKGFVGTQAGAERR